MPVARVVVDRRGPAGLWLPVVFIRPRDGDTAEFGVRGSKYIWAIRFLDCWAGKKWQPHGSRAAKRAHQLLRDCTDIRLHFPSLSNSVYLLKNATFDRILADVWISSTETISERLVAEGHAWATKAEQDAAEAEMGIDQ